MGLAHCWRVPFWLGSLFLVAGLLSFALVNRLVTIFYLRHDGWLFFSALGPLILGFWVTLWPRSWLICQPIGLASTFWFRRSSSLLFVGLREGFPLFAGTSWAMSRVCTLPSTQFLLWMRPSSIFLSFSDGGCHSAGPSWFFFFFRRLAGDISKVMMSFLEGRFHSFGASKMGFEFFRLSFCLFPVGFLLKCFFFAAFLYGWMFASGAWPAPFGSRGSAFSAFGHGILFACWFAMRWLFFRSFIEAFWVAILKFFIEVDYLGYVGILELFPFINGGLFGRVMYFLFLALCHFELR